MFATDRKADLKSPLQSEFHEDVGHKGGEDRILALMRGYRLLRFEEEREWSCRLQELRDQVRAEVFQQPIACIFAIAEASHGTRNNVSGLRAVVPNLQKRWSELRGELDFVARWKIEVDAYLPEIAYHLDRLGAGLGRRSAFLPLESDYRFSGIMTCWREHVQEFEVTLSNTAQNRMALLQAHEERVLMPAGEFLGGYRRVLEAALEYVTLREKFAQHNMRLVVSLAGILGRCAEEKMDLITPCIHGLYRAIDRFDPSHGAKFVTYAPYQIRRYVQRDRSQFRAAIHVPEYLKRAAQKLLQESRRRNPAAPLEQASLREAGTVLGWRPKQIERAISALVTRKVVSLDFQNSEGDSTKSHDLSQLSAVARETNENEQPVMQLSTAEDHAVLSNLFKCLLHPKEQLVLQRRYGLSFGESDDSSTLGELTLEQVGKSIGLTRERVRQIQAQAENILYCSQILHVAPVEKLAKAVACTGINSDASALERVLEARLTGVMEVDQKVARELVMRIASFLVFSTADSERMDELAQSKLDTERYELLASMGAFSDTARGSTDDRIKIQEALVLLVPCYESADIERTVRSLSQADHHSNTFRMPKSSSSEGAPCLERAELPRLASPVAKTMGDKALARNLCAPLRDEPPSPPIEVSEIPERSDTVPTVPLGNTPFSSIPAELLGDLNLGHALKQPALKSWQK